MEDTTQKSLDLEPKTNEEIKALALDLITNKLFTDRHIENDQMIPTVFMPIALGAFQEVDNEELEKLGLIYEHLDKAGPRSINGLPSFMSMQYLSKDDAKRLFQKAHEMTEVIDNIQ